MNKVAITTEGKERSLLVGIFLILTLSYPIVYDKYQYMMSTRFGLDFSIFRLLCSLFLLMVLVTARDLILNRFLKITYTIILFLFLYGELICWIFNENQNYYVIVIESFFLITLIPMDQINLEIPKNHFKNKSDTVMTIIALILFLPFLRYAKFINLNNLFLEDIYETRATFENLNWGYVSYFVGPLSRVILPYLLINSLYRKKYLSAACFSTMTLYLFLCGGLKSIFFGLICAIAFMKGDMEQATKRILNCLFGFCVAAVIIYYLARSSLGVNLIRRVFFVPARLENFYVEYFKGNFTYYMHSGFYFGNNDMLHGAAISRFVGQYVIGTGTNANTGLFVEGYYSFGLFGGCLYTFVPWLFIFFLKSINFDSKYSGIFFVYLYYMNTAILSTLLLTHGFFLFLIMAWLFMREEKQSAF